MNKKLVGFILASLLVIALPMVSYAGPLYKELLSRWGSSASMVEGREFKFLIDPAKTAPSMKEAFQDIYFQAKAVLEKNGLKVTEREKKIWKLRPTKKIFFDTENMELYKKGYLIRATGNYKKGHWDNNVKVAVKRINVPFQTIIDTKLISADGKQSGIVEDNIGLGPKGTLLSYVEKTVVFEINRSVLGQMSLGDFAAYVPELKASGLKPDCKLIAYTAFGTRCRPGVIEIPGLERPAEISMEAWARTEGGKPFVYDFSFGYGGAFTAMQATHEVVEKAMQALCSELNAKLGLPNAERYVGSKVRVFLNQALP